MGLLIGERRLASRLGLVRAID
ncbi:hypothetical protein SGPA1_60310 [Streptomyces misionensis JCM 4497]